MIVDRKIEVEVRGSFVRKDSRIAGIQGEGNSTIMHIVFDNTWAGLAKKITFWNAKGLNPVERILTVDLLTDITQSTLDYSVPIPPEPLEIDGECTFVIDGYKEGMRQRSVQDKLLVKYAPTADTAGEPVDPTPSQAEQLQEQIDTFLDDVREEATRVAKAASSAIASEENAKQSAANAETNANIAVRSAQEARYYSAATDEAKEKAKTEADNAANSAEAAKKARDAAKASADEAAANAGIASQKAEESSQSAERSRLSAEESLANAGIASQKAEESSQSAERSKLSADEASAQALLSKASAEESSASALIAQQAQAGAKSAQAGAETAQAGAETARKSIENMTVSVETLEAGEEATVQKTEKDGVVNLHYGLPQGIQGKQGIQGEVGATGNGIASITLNEDYTLTITFTDGTIYTTPSIRGETGETGATGSTGERGEAAPIITEMTINSNYHLIVTLSDGTSYDAGYCRGASGEGSGDMLSSIYDPTGKVQDVYKYTDDKIEAHNTNSEAHKDILKKYLPLVGGVLTGAITIDSTSGFYGVIKERTIDGITYRTLLGIGSDGSATLEVRSSEDNYATIRNRLGIPPEGGAFLLTDSTAYELYHEGNIPTAENVGAAPVSHTHDDRYYPYSEIDVKLSNKANKSEIVETVLSASGWSGNKYSFESSYPNTSYDIEVFLSPSTDESQVEAFTGAIIVGSPTSNVLTALGTVPTVDVPIYIKVVVK